MALFFNPVHADISPVSLYLSIRCSPLLFTSGTLYALISYYIPGTDSQPAFRCPITIILSSTLKLPKHTLETFLHLPLLPLPGALTPLSLLTYSCFHPHFTSFTSFTLLHSSFFMIIQQLHILLHALSQIFMIFHTSYTYL